MRTHLEGVGEPFDDGDLLHVVVFLSFPLEERGRDRCWHPVAQLLAPPLGPIAFGVPLLPVPCIKADPWYGTGCGCRAPMPSGTVPHSHHPRAG